MHKHGFKFVVHSRYIMEISIYFQTNKNLTHVLQVVTSIPAFHPALEIWPQSPADQQRYLIACSCTQQAHGRPPYNKILIFTFHTKELIAQEGIWQHSPWTKELYSYCALFVNSSANLTSLINKITHLDGTSQLHCG